MAAKFIGRLYNCTEFGTAMTQFGGEVQSNRWWAVDDAGDGRRGKVRANLGDTMCDGIGVADLGGRILKWAKTDEKL